MSVAVNVHAVKGIQRLSKFIPSSKPAKMITNHLCRWRFADANIESQFQVTCNLLSTNSIESILIPKKI